MRGTGVPTVFERFSAEDGGLRVELLVQPAVNYALVHNRVPLVRGSVHHERH